MGEENNKQDLAIRYDDCHATPMVEGLWSARTIAFEERQFVFAKSVRTFLQSFPQTEITRNDRSQLLRSSGSIGANYIEAHEALSRKDFLYRIRICRKEARETLLWLRLLESNTPQQLRQELSVLQNETNQFIAIFTASIKTLEQG